MANINLSWTASVGSTSGTFRLRYWLETTPNDVIVIDNIIGTSYTITGLDGTKTYKGTIESRCGDGSLSSTIAWSAAPTVSGGGGSEGLTTAINGQTTATCSSGVSGTITINSADTRKVRLTTTYTGGTPGNGSTINVTNATTGASVLSFSSPATALYTPTAVTSTVALAGGTYNYTLSVVPCFSGSGQTTLSLVIP